MAGRSAYRSAGTGSSRGGASNGGDRNLWDARRRSFDNWYVSNYPGWPGYGYPYLIDPGFYDWGDSDDAADDGSSGIPDYLNAYPDGGYDAADEAPQQGYSGEIPPWNVQMQRPAGAEASPSLAPEQPLTVIFKSGRAPVKMQNYMMTAKFLTDLDSQHYEQIPLDQIDVAATERANSAAGVGFQIPGASRD
jgi:hypothetical protein